MSHHSITQEPEAKPVMDRRSFLRLTGFSGFGLVLGLGWKTGGQEFIASGADATMVKLSPYIFIETSGAITIMNNMPDMGQGTFQSVPAMIAEELEVSLDQVRIVQTSGEKEYGRQTAGGSGSIRTQYQKMRTVGASAKAILILAASQRWNVPVSSCYASNASVYHQPSGKSFTYGELAADAAKLPIPQEPALKDPKDFKIIGKKSPRGDVPLKVSGKAVYGIDVDLPGMLYASVAHCPVFNSSLISYDDADTMRIKGVKKIIKFQRALGAHKYDAVAVIADTYWAAYQGKLALKVKWDYHGNDSFDTDVYEQSLRDLANQEGQIVSNAGNFDSAYETAPVKLTAFYELPMVSHSPMEPQNCTAQWHGKDQLEIWVSSQGADRVKSDIAKNIDIPADNIKVNILFSGGGFGRRLYNDYAVEAASIARELDVPVKMIWTREEDTQLGPFRPCTFSAMKAGLADDGKPVAFQHKVISPSMGSTMEDKKDTSGESSSMTEGISTQAYELPNMKNEYVFSQVHVPLAAWRSVTSSTVAFAHECFIDEMAVRAGKDPLQYRLDVLLTKPSDTKRLLEKLKEVSNWDKPLPQGWGRGVAQYEFFAGLGGYVVEVSSKDKSSVHIEKVYMVIDLGTVVNPDTVALQVEGAATMALTAAIKSAIIFKNGQTRQTNFHNYPLVRINEMPEVEVHIIAEGGPKIRGVGEPGLPPFAPALANAIFAATGKRIRKLPFNINKV
ncbi:MAG TPA: molybdopterin cofactor-binding domain-containing protein [Puia sp.]|nr:molybdopterin cofactor-binding domain-containing protein [Puia sp.]